MDIQNCKKIEIGAALQAGEIPVPAELFLLTGNSAEFPVKQKGIYERAMFYNFGSYKL